MGNDEWFQSMMIGFIYGDWFQVSFFRFRCALNEINERVLLRVLLISISMGPERWILDKKMHIVYSKIKNENFLPWSLKKPTAHPNFNASSKDGANFWRDPNF